MIEWFKKLSEPWQIAIFTAGLTLIGGLFALVRSRFGKKKDPSIDPNTFLNRYDKNAGDLTRAQEKIKQLEEQLDRPQLSAGPGESQIMLPTQEAKDLAAQIEDDDGLYAQALKAIAEGNNEQADEFLDEAQQLMDHVQEQKDRAQAKIYAARMQNASYAGRPRDALQYCDKLTALAGEDPQQLRWMANVYYDNALYQKAEPLIQRALTIDEATLGKDHPKVATDLNNLAVLYQATNRLSEAEPLMERTLAIVVASYGRDHPKVARRLNNLAQLYQATNRLKKAELLMVRVVEILENPDGEPLPNYAIALNNLAMLYRKTDRLAEAEPLMERALAIDEASFGRDHPNVARNLNNLAMLYKDTNRLSEAEPMLTRAIKIMEKSFGPNHPNTITLRKNREICRKKMKDPAERGKN